MSRVGKMPVIVPAGVDVSLKDGQINVKGTGGTLAIAQNVLVTVTTENGQLKFTPANESREANAMSGTIRQLVTSPRCQVESNGWILASGEHRHASWHHSVHARADRNFD